MSRFREGDITKQFHFIGPRGRKHYMYKVISYSPEYDTLRAFDVIELAKKGKSEAFNCDVRLLEGEDTEIICRAYIAKEEV